MSELDVAFALGFVVIIIKDLVLPLVRMVHRRVNGTPGNPGNSEITRVRDAQIKIFETLTEYGERLAAIETELKLSRRRDHTDPASG